MTNKQTILVVDDDAPVREMLAITLEAKYDVLKARDGLDAICIYERNAERVAAIVTDLQMPRLNGHLVAEWVHHINSRLPVIIMSGAIRKKEFAELEPDSFVTFLEKPFDAQQIESLLKSMLTRKLDEAA
jgi:DNA-binding NtrC family response regulator